MLIDDGKGRGYKAEVNPQNQLVVKAITEDFAAHISSDEALVFSVVAIDAGPVAAEYPLYVQNTSDLEFAVDKILTSSVNADVIWKLHHVTGTASGASVITPVNLNLSSGNVAELTCRGGAGGVASLTSANVLYSWYNGAVYNAEHIELHGLLLLGKNDAIALEYAAGTGGAITAAILGHFRGADD